MAKVREVTKEEEDYIKDNLRYDPDTGYLWWIKQTVGRGLNKPAGSIGNRGYVRIHIKDLNNSISKKYPAHRLAWLLFYGTWPKDQIDHINNIKDDNRIINLREATGFENQRNQKPQTGKTSKYKGVHWYKQTCKWRAQIQNKHKNIYLGYYNTEEEAALAYNKAALEYFGEFAKINDVTP